MPEKHEMSDVEKAATLIGAALTDCLFTPHESVNLIEQPNVVDGLYAIAAAIRYHADTVAREIGAMPVGGDS